LPEEFQARFPVLTEALQGTYDAGNGKAVVPPCTINLFLEGGQLKFCVIPKDDARVAFGCVREPWEGLAGVESELAARRFEWKISKRR
jgi:hypothetical protein